MSVPFAQLKRLCNFFHSILGPRPPAPSGYAYVGLLAVLGFWGKAPAAKRFPGYYRGLRERWMMESRFYFFCHTPKSGGTVPPLQKVRGVRVRTPRKLRL